MVNEISRKLFSNSLNFNIGKEHHTFFEKAAAREIALMRFYGEFYKKLDLCLETLPIGELVLTDKNIEIRACQDYRTDKKKGGGNASNFLSNSSFSAIDSNTLSVLEGLLKDLIPWRKGPYGIHGISIVSEWKSHLKWNRIKEYLLPDECAGKCIVDVGANNGYFMFRLAEMDVEWMIGLEPTYRYVAQYDLIRSCWLNKSNKSINECVSSRQVLLLLGYEELSLLEGRVDIILLLGILYHHPNPLFILSLVYKALRKSGKVLIDCEGIEDSENVALFPEKTYTGKRGFWFLPTRQVLVAWLRRIGFRNITVFYTETLSVEEQQKSSWSPFDSLAEGLKWSEKNNEKTTKQQDSTFRTVEGYLPPVRYYICAYKS